MTYGFQTFTDAGDIQVDGILPQLELILTGTASVSSYSNMVYGGGSRRQVISIPIAYNDKDIFVMIKPSIESGTKKCGVWKYKEGGQWKLWFWSSDQWTAENIAYTVWIHGSNNWVDSEYGLTVFNPDGDVSFSSERVNFRGLNAGLGVLSRSTGIGPLSHANLTGVYALYTGTNFVERDFDGPPTFDPNIDDPGEEGYATWWYHSQIVFNYSTSQISMEAASYYSKALYFTDKGGSSTRTLVTGKIV